ncbi:trypsin-like serine protease [Hoyosella rhizosphaerae]|uniref:Peptidase S1 domain-containing protein n=1 Tax=Hoyosella rhizosphaerae TaxID=1755582 RepID=A0A916UD54_9ACTN|nr:trypsin-like serine protease [Hoyosella rhizosphaerae]MBN4925696.1 trypsin-like serine protease [Hoyosella rhizosphaerae]GGC68639.1 hypothetical protein GCM10011410_21760 [Hoyosella rhizosphaerae]
MIDGVRNTIVAAATAAVAAITLGLTTAGAITNGEPDGKGHPYVGLMMAVGPNGAPSGACSGALVSNRIFVTAGHCTADAASARIWFDADVESGWPDNGFPFFGEASGTPYTHPEFDRENFRYRDVGVVVLDEPVNKPRYASLPELNQLDSLATQRGQQDVTFTAVGYGSQGMKPDRADAMLPTRMLAHPKLNQINSGRTGDYSMLVSANANTGGTCQGDSGGPILSGTSDVLVAVTSYSVNPKCAGTNGAFRMDRSWSLNWIIEAFSDYL